MDQSEALEAIRIIAEASLDVVDVEVLHARLREIIEMASSATEHRRS
ncbi:hypothetical protein [Tardiphaga sp. P9-11]|nr:hypothetical protein [Tardiphaga sp. P9-11]